MILARDNKSTFILTENKEIILKSQGRTKFLGWIHKKGDVISYYKDEKEKDTFLKLDAWSIPDVIFQLINGMINIRTSKGIYRISKSDASLVREYLHFKRSGIETKVYIPKKHFNFEPI